MSFGGKGRPCRLSRCQFNHNIEQGIYLQQGRPEQGSKFMQISDCLILNNGQAGIALAEVSGRVLNCTVVGNPWGIEFRGNQLISNSIIYDNRWSLLAHLGQTIVQKCLVQGGQSRVLFDGDPGTFLTFKDLVDGIPNFVSPSTGDYSLRDDSPAIGSGAPLPADVTDVRLSEPPGSALDLGAFENRLSRPLSLIYQTQTRGKIGQDIAFSAPLSYSPSRVIGIGLPTGLSESIENGFVRLIGKPTEAGTFSVKLLVENPAGTSTNMLTVVVDKGTPQVTWTPPNLLFFGAVLDTNFFNPVSSIPGVFTFDPPLGPQPKVGNGFNASVTFVPSDTANFETLKVTRQFNVLKANQSITFDPPPTTVLGDPSIPLNGYATSGLPLAYQAAQILFCKSFYH